MVTPLDLSSLSDRYWRERCFPPQQLGAQASQLGQVPGQRWSEEGSRPMWMTRDLSL
jgi:hypothetical protein